MFFGIHREFSENQIFGVKTKKKIVSENISFLVFIMNVEQTKIYRLTRPIHNGNL